MSIPRLPAAASRPPGLPHYLFFSLLPGSDEVEQVDRLAAALAEQEAPRKRVRTERMHATLADGPVGTLQLGRVPSFRAGSQRPHPHVPWPQARMPTVTLHVTLYCTPQPLPELAVHPMRRAMRSFALLHNVRGSSGPYECLGVWALRAQWAIKKGAASACLESARARFGLNCFKPWS